jgi:hypothetical protein
MKKEYILKRTDIRPEWCPHKRCKINRTFQNKMCIGILSKPIKHGKGYNNYRLCLRGVLPANAIFDLQINDTDIWWFKLLFNSVQENRQ